MPFWMASVVAAAQTADFDTLAEGTNGVQIADGGLVFQNMDNRGLTVPPGNIAIEQGDGDLTGFAGFTPLNTLGFGGFSAGPGVGFGRFGSIEITNNGLGESAELTVFESGGNNGTALNLEALSGGVVVASDSAFLSAGFGITAHTLTVSGSTFDLLRLSIGPNATDFAFLVVDTVTIVPPVVPVDSGDTGLPTIGDSGGSGTPTTPPTDTGAPTGTGDTGIPPETDTDTDADTDADTDTDTDADSDADADTDADADADADADVPPDDTGDDGDKGEGCGCGTGGSAGLVVVGLAGLLARRRRGPERASEQGTRRVVSV